MRVGGRSSWRSIFRKFLAIALGLIAISFISAAGLRAQSRAMSQEPAGLAPDPAAHSGAVIQAYAARVIGLRGIAGVHTWVAVKPEGASAYTVYEVVGWRLRWNTSVVVERQRQPDAPWFGSPAELLADVRGPEAEVLIERVARAAKDYPYTNEYTMWPGPNSNTFTAWIARAVPELKIDLPPTAIGKDYLRDRVFASAPSGSGFQFSLAGLLGLTASAVEGLEVNLLGLSFGVNPFDPALRLPFIGRLGPSRGEARERAQPESQRLPETASPP